VRQVGASLLIQPGTLLRKQDAGETIDRRGFSQMTVEDREGALAKGCFG
jgi:hypothetical protein